MLSRFVALSVSPILKASSNGSHAAVSHVINGVRTKAELDEVLGGMWTGALDSSNENFARWHECKCSGILCRPFLSPETLF